MRYIGMIIALSLLLATAAFAQPDTESVYAPPEPAREDQGVNEGGVSFKLDISYMTDYVFRGIDRSESGGSEDSPNLQFDSAVSFDLGRWPHPFLGAFVNVYDSDPISRFQEIRPYFGADLRLRPFLFTVGHNNYIYPDRDRFNTAEVFLKVTFDDSYCFKTENPVFSPYVYAAYDYDAIHGEYIECGVSHDFVLEDLPITLTPQAHVAYVVSCDTFRAGNNGPIAGPDPGFAFAATGHDTGFQHYQIGLVGKYSLNTLFNMPKRYGEFSLKGYLFYTDGIDNKLRADSEMWGGVGISFSY